MLTTMKWLALATLLFFSTPSVPQLDVQSKAIQYATCFAEELGVDDWKISVVFVDLDDVGWAARTNADGQHKYAFIQVNLNYTNYENVRMVMLHEILHVVTGELATLAYTVPGPAALFAWEHTVRNLESWKHLERVCR